MSSNTGEAPQSFLLSKANHLVSQRGLKGFFAGGITGGIEIRISYPTEFIKTQLQLDGIGNRSRYKGIADCINQTIKKNGFLGLYRGFSAMTTGSMPTIAARFGTFEVVRCFFVDSRGQMSNTGKIVSGLVAGMCEAALVVTPIETIKVKLINDQRSSTPKFKGFLHATKMILKNEGFAGIYQGAVPTIFRQGSNQAIRFFVIENLKDEYTNNDRSKPIPKSVVGGMGVIAGTCSVVANTPSDVIKTRMQSLGASRYKNSLDCAFQIWREEGAGAFYKGALPRLIRVCMDVSITFMIYDSVMELLDLAWPDT